MIVYRKKSINPFRITAIIRIIAHSPIFRAVFQVKEIHTAFKKRMENQEN